MSMNITSEERDGQINKGRGMSEFVHWMGRHMKAYGREKLRKNVIPVKMQVIPEQTFISMAVDIDCWVTESARQEGTK